MARLIRNKDLSPSTASKDIQQSFLFLEVLSEEIKGTVHRNIMKKHEYSAGNKWKLLRKYKLIKYASRKIRND